MKKTILPPPSRQSNFELLRLVAMMLVLIVHSDWLSLGKPTMLEAQTAPLNVAARSFFQSMAIVCVDVFVLISGWFSIKPSIRSFSKFIFQCMFFTTAIYVVLLLVGELPMSIASVREYIRQLVSFNWFVLAYVCLYILSPVLNAFIVNSDRRTIELTLVGFYTFQTIYSWMLPVAQYFVYGYSAISFIGLYLLARYVRLFNPRWVAMFRSRYLLIYVIITLFMTAVSFVGFRVGVGGIAMRMWYYSSPFVVLSALSLLLYFSEIKLQSRFVNWCASSCFAIYLLHCSGFVCDPYFKPTIVAIYSSHSGIE